MPAASTPARHLLSVDQSSACRCQAGSSDKCGKAEPSVLKGANWSKETVETTPKQSPPTDFGPITVTPIDFGPCSPFFLYIENVLGGWPWMRTGTRYVRILDAENAELEEAQSRPAAVLRCPASVLPRPRDWTSDTSFRLPLTPDLVSGSGSGSGWCAAWNLADHAMPRSRSPASPSRRPAPMTTPDRPPPWPSTPSPSYYGRATTEYVERAVGFPVLRVMFLTGLGPRGLLLRSRPPALHGLQDPPAGRRSRPPIPLPRQGCHCPRHPERSHGLEEGASSVEYSVRPRKMHTQWISRR